MNMDLPIEVTLAPADPKEQINPTYSPETGLFIPASIEEAIIELDKMLHPEFIAEARAMTELEFLNSQHLGLEMWIRNNWELWGINPLTQSLQTQNMTHPDEMASFLLGQFWQHLQQNSTADEGNSDRIMDKQLNLFDLGPEPTRKQQKLEMSRDQFIQWKEQIARHQQATRETYPQQSTLFDTGVNQFDSEKIDPFQLTQYATRFYDLPPMKLSEEGDPCIYFLLDNASHLILYIGETIHSNKRWKGGHHCEDYLKKYVQLNRKHGLEVLPVLAFEWGAPAETRLRQKMEYSLIKKWRSPFNKENRAQWGHPFGE